MITKTSMGQLDNKSVNRFKKKESNYLQTQNLKKPNSKVNDSISYEIKKELWNLSKSSVKTGSSEFEYIGPDNTNNLCGAGRVNAICVDPLNSEHLWIGAASGGLWESTNSGSTWLPRTDRFPTLGVTQIEYHTTISNIIYLATGDGNGYDVLSFGLLKSVDGGQNWDSTGLTFSLQPGEFIQSFSVNPSDGDKLIVLSNQRVYKSINGGLTFTTIMSGFFSSIVRDPLNTNMVYISKSESFARILKSIDDGDNWSYVDSFLPTNLYKYELATSPSFPSEIFAAGIKDGTDSLTIFRSFDGGGNWSMSQTHNIAQQSWFNIYFDVSDELPIRYYFGAVWSWKSTDEGQTFNTMSEWDPVHCDHHYFKQIDNGVFFDCSDGGVYKSNDDGQTWNNLNNNLGAYQFYRLDVCESDTSSLGAGAQDNCYVFKNTGTSNNWNSAVGGDIMEVLINPINPLNQYVNGIGGVIIKTNDGGVNWDFPNTTVELPEWSGEWITPLCMNQNTPNILYTGFDDVWKSDDGSISWTKISNNLNSGINLTCLELAESDTMTIYASDRNNFYVTFNQGQSWINQTSNIPFSGLIERITVKKNNNLEVWVVCNSYQSGKKVYKSLDGGFNWTNETFNLPNIPFSCIEFINDSLNTCFIGSQFGLYYKNNSTLNWIKLDNGIPNSLISDLRYNNYSHTLFCSTYGRGMWKLNLESYIANFEEQELSSIFEIYPNPTIDNIFIKAKDQDLKLDYYLYDSKGVELSRNFDFYGGLITLNMYPSGIYYLKINSNQESSIKRIIKN